MSKIKKVIEKGKVITTKRQPLPITKVRINRGELHFNKQLSKNVVRFLIGMGKVEKGFKQIPCSIEERSHYMYLRLAVPPEESQKANAVMLKNHIIYVREKGFRKSYYRRFKSEYDMTVLNPDPSNFVIAISKSSQKLNVAVSKSLVK